MWVNQPEPKGFGNAVLMAQPFVQNEQCLVHAGDSCIISKDMDYIKKLLDAYERFNADAAFIATKPGINGEIQLTDAIQKLIEWGLKVYAVKLDESYSHLDIGSPERYWGALELSYQRFCKRTTT